MLRGLLDFLTRIFALWTRFNKLEKEFAALRADHDRLNDLVERLVFEMQRDRENAAHQRVNLQLLLENTLLKFERRLPPAKPPKDK